MSSPKCSSITCDEFQNHLKDARNYLLKYYPEFKHANTSDFEIQEFSRYWTAHHFEDDPKAGPLGWTAIQSIRSLSACFNVVLTPSPEFNKFVVTELSKLPSDQSINVRDIVKRIWNWPMTGYMKFIETRECKDHDIHDIHVKVQTVLRSTNAKYQFENGHYLRLSVPGVNKVIFDSAKAFLGNLTNNLCLNSETDHVSLVPSDVIAKLDQTRWTKFFDKYCKKQVNDICLDHFAHTFSFDWARFGVCVVARLKSKNLDDFMIEFNREFSLDIKPKFHVTFAVGPRSSNK